MGRHRYPVCSNCYSKVPYTIEPWSLSIFFPEGSDFFKHITRDQNFCSGCANKVLFDAVYKDMTFYKGAQIYKAIVEKNLKEVLPSLFMILCPDCNDANLALDYFIEDFPVLQKIQRSLLSGIGLSPNATDGILFCKTCTERREIKAMKIVTDPKTVWFHKTAKEDLNPMIWTISDDRH